MRVKPKAITLDFHETLAHLRVGKGRGVLYHEFLAAQGLEADDWQHEVIYDVFEFYGEEYDPLAPPKVKFEFWAEFAGRLFKRTGVVDNGNRLAKTHALEIRDIFGSGQFRLYPEVRMVLRDLNNRGIPLAVVSNWPAGLGKFCHELGILSHFEDVIASAEVGHEKPAREIFLKACRRLGRQPSDVLHIGDSLEADFEGARSAGLDAVLIDRSGGRVVRDSEVISSLAQIAGVLGL